MNTKNEFELLVLNDFSEIEEDKPFQLEIEVVNKADETLFDLSIFLIAPKILKPTKDLFSWYLEKLSSNSNITFKTEATIENLNENIVLFLRAFYRKKGDTSHQIFTSNPIIFNKTDTKINCDIFSSIIKIRNLKKIIDVLPFARKIFKNDFGTFVEIEINVFFSDNQKKQNKLQFNKNFLINSSNDIILSSLIFGDYFATTFHDSVYLEIPIFFDM